MSGIFTKLMTLGLYTIVWQHASPWQLPADALWVWAVGLVFCYWLHRFGHESAVLWAAHVVHHQSEDYNLSTALRRTSSGWLFYLPMGPRRDVGFHCDSMRPAVTSDSGGFYKNNFRVSFDAIQFLQDFIGLRDLCIHAGIRSVHDSYHRA